MQKELENLFRVIRENNNVFHDCADDLELAEDAVNSFIDYFNAVVNMELRIVSQRTDGISSYIFRQMDNERREMHNIAIEYCRLLNDLCQKYNTPKVCEINMNDRHAVAQYIGNTVNTIYMHGIESERTFDDLVSKYAHENPIRSFSAEDLER